MGRDDRPRGPGGPGGYGGGGGGGFRSFDGPPEPGWDPTAPAENEWDDRKRRKGPKRKDTQTEEVDERRPKTRGAGRKGRIDDFLDDEDW